MIGIPLAAFLCESLLGWPSIFYLCGMELHMSGEIKRVIKDKTGNLAILGVVWSLAWRLFVPNSPAECKVMSKKERAYLNSRDDLCKSTRSKVIFKRKNRFLPEIGVLYPHLESKITLLVFQKQIRDFRDV